MVKQWRARPAVAMALLLGLAACGGGGSNNPPPGVTLLAPERYFPSRIGSQYTYHLATLKLPFLPGEDEDLTYNVEANPFANGEYYNLVDTDGANDGPLFDGLKFLGCLEELNGAPTAAELAVVLGDAPEVLPSVLTGLGQEWTSSFVTQRENGNAYRLQGTSTLAAVEDLTLGSTLFSDCLRVDVQFSYTYDRGGDGLELNEIPLITGSYWLAPDIGPILGLARVAGVTVGRVQLVSAFTL